MKSLTELAESIDQPSPEERKRNLGENARHWLRVDYEAISAALDIELNPEISPLAICRIVSCRLSSMSSEERRDIPEFIWDCLEALDVTGMGRFVDYHPERGKSDSAKNLPFRILKRARDEISIVPHKQPLKALCEELGASARWRAWESTHRPDARIDQGAIIMKSRQFEPWGESQLEKIFESFYGGS